MVVHALARRAEPLPSLGARTATRARPSSYGSGWRCAATMGVHAARVFDAAAAAWPRRPLQRTLADLLAIAPTPEIADAKSRSPRDGRSIGLLCLPSERAATPPSMPSHQQCHLRSPSHSTKRSDLRASAWARNPASRLASVARCCFRRTRATCACLAFSLGSPRKASASTQSTMATAAPARATWARSMCRKRSHTPPMPAGSRASRWSSPTTPSTTSLPSWGARPFCRGQPRVEYPSGAKSGACVPSPKPPSAKASSTSSASAVVIECRVGAHGRPAGDRLIVSVSQLQACSSEACLSAVARQTPRCGPGRDVWTCASGASVPVA